MKDDTRNIDSYTAALDDIRSSPRSEGTLHRIVRRPDEDEREPLEVGRLDPDEGLVGDNWSSRPSSRTADKSPHPDCQLTLMSSRVASLIAGEPENWDPFGDQLFVDFDLSQDNVPPGTRLALGDAVLETTDQAHNGCKKFALRFGHDALRFVSLKTERSLHLRGIYARVVRAGEIRVGDTIRRLPLDA